MKPKQAFGELGIYLNVNSRLNLESDRQIPCEKVI